MLAKRLAKLEAMRPVREVSPLIDLAALPPDVLERIMKAEADGTFPQLLSNDDLSALLVLADEQRAT